LTINKQQKATFSTKADVDLEENLKDNLNKSYFELIHGLRLRLLGGALAPPLAPPSSHLKMKGGGGGGSGSGSAGSAAAQALAPPTPALASEKKIEGRKQTILILSLENI
jgi:hypothetical protein